MGVFLCKFLEKEENKYMDNNFIVELIARLNTANVATDYERIKRELSNKKIDIRTAIDSATSKQEIQNLAVNLQKVLSDAGLHIDTSRISSSIRELQRELNTVDPKKINDLASSMLTFRDNNTRMSSEMKSRLNEMYNSLVNGANISERELKELTQDFAKLKLEVRNAGMLGKSFGDKMKNAWSKFSEWGFATGIMTKGIQTVKDMFSNVVELDNSLLELSKVSDLSASGLANVTEEAYKLGEEVGRTGKQVIDATTEFKRAGYELNASMEMAKSALVMTNVAEGIEDTADAAGTLISVLKGYNMSESETMSIVDKINQVSNTSPIGFDQIAEGLERTAGTMAQSGTTIDQTIGLITAGYAQLRNVEKVSTGLITLSARLRGVGEDGETIDGLSAQLQEDFGKIGVAIENADGSLRSIYQIAQDYSKVLPTLTDKQKQYYAELAAGKRQVTVWNAITQQFQDAEHAVEQSLNSVGSASEENAKYLDSISGKTEQFKSAFEDLSQSIIDSDLIKFFVDFGTTAVKAIDWVTDSFGSLTTLSLGAGLFAGLKNVGINMLVAYLSNRYCFELPTI